MRAATSSALGVLLYEMLAGRRAFEAESTAGLLSAVLRDDPPPLRTINASVPRSVERITDRCLEKEPGQRYQTAADLKRALEDARDDLTAIPGAAPATSIAGPPSPTAQAPVAALRRRVRGHSATLPLAPPSVPCCSSPLVPSTRQWS